MGTRTERLTSTQITELVNDFLGRLGSSHVTAPRGPFITVIGGAPGSGKTTIAHKLAYVSGSFHVQANSARKLLRERGFLRGHNVRLVVLAVAERLLSQKWSVVLDGTIIEETDRKTLKELTKKHEAKTFFSMVTCNPEIAKDRARTRYADKRPSTFDDWRCTPSKFDEYLGSIYKRTILVEKVLIDDSSGEIEIIDNNIAKSELCSQVHILWAQIKKKL